MKCQSQISSKCKKTFKKEAAAYIWHEGKCLTVCSNCQWLIKTNNKLTGNPAGRPREK